MFAADEKAGSASPFEAFGLEFVAALLAKEPLTCPVWRPFVWKSRRCRCRRRRQRRRLLGNKWWNNRDFKQSARRLLKITTARSRFARLLESNFLVCYREKVILIEDEKLSEARNSLLSASSKFESENVSLKKFKLNRFRLEYET